MKTVMRKIIILFNICLLLLFIQSCSVTKRHYLPGYSVEWNKNKVDERTSDLITNAPIIDALGNDKDYVYDNSPEITRSSDEMPVSASIDEPESYIPSKLLLKLGKAKKNILLKSVEECDVLSLKNGEEIKGKVVEVSQTEIKYKKCDNLDGPLYIIPKSDVAKIKFSNGTTEVINAISPKDETDYYGPSSKPENKVYSGKTKVNRFALVSMISAILSIIIFPIIPLPIIFGIIALKQIKKNPEAYTGKWMAVVGLVIGGIMFLAVLAFIALFILSFLI